MYQHILIATDGSELAQKGLDHGLSLAKALDAKVSVLTVTEPFPVYGMAGNFAWVGSPADIDSYNEASKEFAEKVLAAASEAAARLGVQTQTLHADDSTPAEAILATAEAKGCDLIVMASHGRRGLNRMLLGSQTLEVVTHSKVPVLVIK
ncbi:nucleotide-binding universal stress UspA family protein [Pseudaminobacter salicylatoxidans]|uniref:Universal stress protein n=1 Tax=Pseudaminobacter salicylatoxidans TaxID=93369 RepID=A0A316C4D3_PSESE|nr:universal stress protein [Pseudaminobacter salicylatoxidans]PWJ84153.1 nucleotide-binding universal stress UspA family protein [Pseudaminobacter salicylatoxidans]